jgi:hypothetical protein
MVIVTLTEALHNTVRDSLQRRREIDAAVDPQDQSLQIAHREQALDAHVAVRPLLTRQFPVLVQSRSAQS